MTWKTKLNLNSSTLRSSMLETMAWSDLVPVLWCSFLGASFLLPAPPPAPLLYHKGPPGFTQPLYNQLSQDCPQA